MRDEALDLWSSVLDEFEARLVAYAATLNGAQKPAAFVIPPGIGAMPIEFEDRAMLLRARQHDLENRLRDRLATLREILSGACTVPNSVFVDARV